MTVAEKEHYLSLAGMLVGERLDHKYVLSVDEDRKGCNVLTEHYDYNLSPAVVHLRWK